MMDAYKILIADDPAYHPAYKEAFARHAPDLSLAGSGSEVRRSLGSRRPDLFILSDSLPGADSGELCRLISSMSAVGPVPVLLLASGPLPPSPGGAPWEELVDQVLLKPFTVRMLRERVNIMLARGAATRGRVRGGNGGKGRTLPDLPQEVKDSLQEELDAGALRNARLGARIRELERTLKEAAREKEEKTRLREMVRELEREVEEGKLREVELEVKMEEIIRLKSHFEKRAQDMMEEHLRARRELRRVSASLRESNETLRGELARCSAVVEQAVVAKEKVEERAQAAVQALEREISRLAAELAEAGERPAAGGVAAAESIPPHSALLQRDRPGGGGDPGREEWTRRIVTGGMMLQATLLGPEDLRALPEGRKGDTEPLLCPERLAGPDAGGHDFDRNYYLYVHVLTSESGYPDWARNIHRRLCLRDGSGNEVEARLLGRTKEARVICCRVPVRFSGRDPGPACEVEALAAFPRKGLDASPGILQLVARDVGEPGNSVLTWEMTGGR